MKKNALLVAVLTAALVATTLTALPTASAQSVENIATTEKGVQRYFNREKGGGIGFMAIGGASAIGGGVLLFQDSETVRGVGYPMVGLGLASLLAGAVVYLRTDGQVRELEALLEDDPAAFKRREKERMEHVMLGFDIIKTVEVAALLGGISLALIGKSDENDTLKGVGLGLAGESVALLVMDVIAENRAELYIEVLDGLDTPEDDKEASLKVSGALLGIQGTF